MKRGRTEQGQRRIDGSRLLRFTPGIVLVALLCQLAPASAQEWRVQNSGTSNALNKIFFVDSIHGWAVGENGTILRTTDGGAQWLQEQSQFASAHYIAAFFVDSLHGVIGAQDIILGTTDGGINWARRSAPSSLSSNDIYFSCRDTGWIVGGKTVLKTVDGGSTWISLAVATISGSLRATHFINNKEGWVVGFTGGDNLDSSEIYHTTDAGNSWEIQPSESIGGLHAVSFGNSQLGWATGIFGQGGAYTMLVKTTDGGRNWRFSGPWHDVARMYDRFVALESIDTSFVLIGSNESRSPNIYRSTNAGEMWSRDSIAQATYVNSISCTDATHCWACGGSGRIWRDTPSLLGVHEERTARQVEPKVSIAVSQRRDIIEVTYSLHEPMSITTDIHDVLGKRLVSKSTSVHGEGPQSCTFDVREYPSGVYYIHSAVGSRTYVNSITVTR